MPVESKSVSSQLPCTLSHALRLILSLSSNKLTSQDKSWGEGRHAPAWQPSRVARDGEVGLPQALSA